MSSTTVRLTNSELGALDLTEVGAATGLMWRSPNIVLVGAGPVSRVELGLTSSASPVDTANQYLAARIGEDELGVAGSGPIGFTTLPFDRNELGVMLVPEVVIGEVDGTRFLTFADSIDMAGAQALVAELVAAPAKSTPGKIWLTLDKPAAVWRDDVVARARDRIVETDLQKAVLARVLTLTADTDIPLGPVVSSLAERFDHAMVFAVDGFVGASPELLVSRTDRTVRAHPLAGTAARSSNEAIDAEQIATLLASSKDRVEHQITIDWLLTELLAFCSYVDAEPEPSVLTLANVHHLGTLVEGVLSEPAAPILDLVGAVHPTPALGGAPQAEAIALIGELEGFNRGRYGGPTGWVDAAGNGEFAVGVRTAQIDGATARIAAGVGVVAQSNPQAELEETQAKFRAMLGTLFRL